MVNNDQPDESGNERFDRPDSENEDPTDATSGSGDGDTSFLGRRSVLRITGVTAATGIAAVGPASAEHDASSGKEYDVWTVTGEEVYDLSDGEVLEDVLVDQTADGAVLTIRSQNKSGWEVRNIGFMGVGQAGDGSNRFQFQVSTPSGGQGLIENVWANGKARDGQPASELGGIFLRSPHAGHIDIRHTHIEGFGNNAVYASNPGKDHGRDGAVALENCYHRDNTSTQFRIGTPDSTVRNSVAVINDPDGKRGPYPGSSNRNARGFWGKHFRDQVIENSSVYVSRDDVNPGGAFEARYIEDRSHGEKAVGEVVGCEVNADTPTTARMTSNGDINFTNLGESPTVDVIQDGGVPMSPEMAARGEREMPPSLPG